MNARDRYNRIARERRSRHTDKFWNRHDKQDYECPDCGRGIDEVVWFEVHHKNGIPLDGAWDNLIALCRRCHYLRHGRTPPRTLEDWKAEMRSLGSA